MNNKLFNNTKLVDIISDFNESVLPLNGMKGTHSDFHKKVQQLINPILLKYSLVSSTWEINYYFDSAYYKIISYNRRFEQDLRTTTYNSKGKFYEILFTTELDANLTGLEAINILKRNVALKAIESIESHIKQLEEDILLNEKCLQEQKNKLSLLELQRHETNKQ